MQLRQLNYKHLHYFYVVASEGGVNKAAETLHLTPQTISGQLTQLEDMLQLKLFAKAGRNLRLTEEGKMVMNYASQIFSLGDQLITGLQSQNTKGQQRITIGLLDSIPKIIAYEILKPVMEKEDYVITCIEGDIEKLMAELAVNKVDMVFSDLTLNNTFSVKAYSQLIGESTLSCFATGDLAKLYRKNFPASMEGAPVLLPRESSFIGRELHRWLQQQSWHMRVRGYFDDSALLKAFGQAGEGVFFMPSVIEKEICLQFGVKVIGHVNEIRDRYYAIRSRRSQNNPILEKICEHARTRIFHLE